MKTRGKLKTIAFESESEAESLQSDEDEIASETHPEPKIISERTIILKPIMRIDYTDDYKPANIKKHAPTYKDLDGGKKNQYCSICKKYFNRAPAHPRNMHNHIMNEHSEENADGTFSCKICPKVSLTRVAVKKHFDQSHRMFDKPKICHVCGTELLHYGTAAKHYATHKAKDQADLNNKFPAECEECGVQFTTKTAFYLHRKSFHTDTTKVKCDLCDKAFRNKPQLRVHKVQAHMQKRFGCDFCDWKCSYKYMVKEHIKKRHPERFTQMDFSNIKRGRISKDKIVKEIMENEQSGAS